MEFQLANSGFENLPFVVCTMPKISATIFPKRSAKISWISCVHLGGHFWKLLKKCYFVSWSPIYTQSRYDSVAVVQMVWRKFCSGRYLVLLSQFRLLTLSWKQKMINAVSWPILGVQQLEKLPSHVSEQTTVLKGGYSQAVVTILT